MVLSAFPTNTGGMALYTKLGFRTVGIYKDQGQLDAMGRTSSWRSSSERGTLGYLA